MSESEGPGVSPLGLDIPIEGLRPRVVLGLLLGGSLAGVWVTHAADALAVRAATWVLVVSTGLLVGGLHWRLHLFDREPFAERDTCRLVEHRWRRLETVSVWVFTLAGAAYLAVGANGSSFGAGAIALGAGLPSGLVLWGSLRWTDSDSTRRRLRVVLFLVVLVSLCGLARVETAGSVVDWLVRVGHLAGFALWIGGAGWHNFIVRPTVQSRPRGKDALKRQARRFRRHLPVVIPLVFVTGLYQTDRLVGLSPSALGGSSLRHLVVVKLAVLFGLSALVLASVRRT